MVAFEAAIEICSLFCFLGLVPDHTDLSHLFGLEHLFLGGLHPSLEDVHQGVLSLGSKLFEYHLGLFIHIVGACVIIETSLYFHTGVMFGHDLFDVLVECASLLLTKFLGLLHHYEIVLSALFIDLLDSGILLF